MKRTINLLASLAILLVFFNSCGKNNTTNDPIITAVSFDSNYLDKIIIIDSTAAGEDSSQVEILKKPPGKERYIERLPDKLF